MTDSSLFGWNPSYHEISEPPKKCTVVNLEEREESEATQELLNLPGFETAFRRAVRQAEAGEVVRFEDIHRDV